MRRILKRHYALMRGHFGPTHWWPGDTPFEIAAGAILTQNTAWHNVEKALDNLRSAEALDPNTLLSMPVTQLETLLRPSGFFRVKTRRLQEFCAYLIERYGGDMIRLAATPLDRLRSELLAVHGIGPETADDILLYACGKPVFVVDAYTRRILSRHGLVPFSIGYEALRQVYETHLDTDLELFQDYHGQIVFTAKTFCRSRPNCAGCPLESTLEPGQPLNHEQIG
jgi:endonuclease III related protein